jgi:ribose-phosphate pyrophosphokinase
MRMSVFALNTSQSWATEVANGLHIRLAEHEEREFDDGEHKARSLQSVRGRDVAVIQSLYAEAEHSVNDKLCRLLFFVGALRDAGAVRILVVMPYVAYARKDEKTKTRDPLTLRYIAQMLEAVGVNHLITLDAHNPGALQNAFRIPTDNLSARVLFAPVLAELLMEKRIENNRLVIVSPDIGGIKRAAQLQTALASRIDSELTRAFIDKQRSGGRVSGGQVIGDVRDSTVVIVDDMVSSGTTLRRAIDTLQAQGARRIIATASHGLFVGDAAATIADPRLECILITDSIPPFRLSPAIQAKKVKLVSAAPLFAEVLSRIDSNASVSDLYALENDRQVTG